MEYKFFNPNNLKDPSFQITFRRYFRYYLRKIAFYSYVKKFEKFVNSNPFYIEFFEKYSGIEYVLIRHFCNRLFSAKQRYDCVLSDLTFMQELYLKKGICLWEKPIEIWRENGAESSYNLSLEKNPEIAEEGFWAVVLRDGSGGRIYQASFAITPQKDLLIGSVQGSKENGVNEEIKILTKKLFGLRPPSFLIEVLKILTRVLGCSQTLGIFPKSQIRFIKGVKKGFYVDYDKIWLEAYGEVAKIGSHHYYILAHKQKSLEEISSHKRSMYKKRFEMLEMIENDLNQKFQVQK